MDPEGLLHKGLVILQTDVNGQMEDLASALAHIKQACKIGEVSSVYLHYISADMISSHRGQLVTAVTILTNNGPEELAQQLETVRKGWKIRVDPILVLYEDETRMTPRLTLPHPDMHRLPHWLIPASEVWSDTAHPVLRKTLKELSEEKDWGGWGEFHAQGKALLEFYYKQKK